MTLGVYSIRDAKVGFLNPTFEISDDVAMRNFAHAVTHSDSILKSSSKDFSLWKIGLFDSNSGELIMAAHEEFRPIIEATDCISK